MSCRKAGPSWASIPSDAVAFFEQQKWYPYYNVLMFPKILNELPEDVFDRMLAAIQNAAQAGRFSEGRSRDYYDVISHSPSQLQEGKEQQLRFAERIIDAINDRDEFEIDDTIPELWNRPGREDRQLSHFMFQIIKLRRKEIIAGNIHRQ